MAVAAEVCQPPHGPQALAEQPFKTLVGAALEPRQPSRKRATRVTSLVSIRGTCSTPPIRRRTPTELVATRSTVVTRDVWSLPPASASPAPAARGGSRRGCRTATCSGTGTALELSHFDNLDRKVFVAGFAEPNLMGSRVGLRLRTDATDDGRGRHAWSACRASLDARRARELFWIEPERRGSIRDGREFGASRVEQRVATASFGWSAGLGFASRWRVGFHHPLLRFFRRQYCLIQSGIQ